jgi:glycosyltransferase involved in cell wall biosynthesis
MRVAVVFWKLSPTGGGVHTFTEDVYEALLRAEPDSRHTFVFYVTGAEVHPPSGVLRIPFSRRERYRRGAIYLLRDMQDRAGIPRRGFRTWLDASLSDQQVDLVWFATNYAEDCDIPFVLTIFDIEHVRQPWFPEVSSAGEWERRHQHYSRYVPRATRVIVPNEAGRHQLARHFDASPERTLVLGHPTPEFARAAARREPLPRERVERLGLRGRYLLYPAQFWAHKNHPTLLDALADLARDGGEPYEAALPGSDKGQLDHVRRLAQEVGVADRVRFLGFVENDDLIALYQHAHALTYMSFFGPENLPPLEAFALGCPVVAADVAGAREQMGDAALLVRPLDPAGLAAAVRRLEDPELREALSRRGRERAEERTADSYVRGVLDFLDEFESVRRLWA